MDWLDAYHPETLVDVIKFRAKQAPFKDYLFKENTLKNLTPLTWWKSLEDKLSPQTNCLTEQVFTATSSSAGLERIFSTFGLVQSKLRNRFGIEKAGKLVALDINFGKKFLGVFNKKKNSFQQKKTVFNKKNTVFVLFKKNCFFFKPCSIKGLLMV